MVPVAASTLGGKEICNFSLALARLHINKTLLAKLSFIDTSTIIVSIAAPEDLPT